jgi:putative MATE family efflux protein
MGHRPMSEDHGALPSDGSTRADKPSVAPHLELPLEPAAEPIPSAPAMAVPSPEAAMVAADALGGMVSLAARGGATWRLVLLLALPVLAQQSLILVVNISDRYLAGNLVGVREQAEAIGFRLLAVGQVASPGSGLGDRTVLAAAAWSAAEELSARQAAFQAAQTTANYLAWFITSYTVLVSVGSTALVARFIGAGDRKLAIRVTHQSLLLGAALGGVATLWALTGGVEWLVAALQLGGEAANLAVAYLQPLFLLIVFQVIETAGIACLVGAGDTKTGLWVMVGVAAVNLPLAWGLCLGWGPLPELGFVGIALGTALSHTIGGLVVLAVLARGRFGLRLEPRLFRPEFDLLGRHLRVGIPAGLDSLSVVAGQFWFLSIVNRLGDVASSAHGIALSWEALGFLSGAAFGTAAMTLVGQNLGAGKPERAAHSAWVACGLGCLVMSVMGAVFFLLAEPMFQLFCPYPSQRPIIDVGVPVLQLVAFAMPPLACCIIFTSALRGAGDTRVPVLFTWVGFFVVRIPLAYWLSLDEINLGPLGVYPGLGLELFGAWLAMFADLLVRGIFFLYRFATGRWQRIRV